MDVRRGCNQFFQVDHLSRFVIAFYLEGTPIDIHSEPLTSKKTKKNKKKQKKPARSFRSMLAYRCCFSSEISMQMLCVFPPAANLRLGL